MKFLIINFLFLLLTTPVFIYLMGARQNIIIFQIFYAISTVYYGVFGIWYWIEYHGGVFLGNNWSLMLNDISNIFIYTYIMVSFLVLGMSKIEIYPKITTRKILFTDKHIFNFAVFLTMLCIFVYLAGYGVQQSGGAVTDNSFLLIAYQFTEIPIALLLYLFSVQKYTKIKYAFFCFYVVFCIIIGFRYRLILLISPIIIYWFMYSKIKIHTRILALFFSAALVVAVFSFMTISRSKFSGLDFDIIQSASFDDILYGFFADTNIIFGLASTLENFGVNWSFAGWEPLVDVFVQYVPRFIYPEKDLYRHLWDVNYGISNSVESLNSATAVPFFGEYYLMYGWTGYFVGIIAYSYCVSFFNRNVEFFCKNQKQFIYGISMVAVFFGYYYFSRGSVSQISKGLLFIILPYIYLVAKTED